MGWIEEKLYDAARLRIYRMVAKKKKKQQYAVPEAVAEEWKKNKDGLIRLLMNLNFDKAGSVAGKGHTHINNIYDIYIYICIYIYILFVYI